MCIIRTRNSFSNPVNYFMFIGISFLVIYIIRLPIWFFHSRCKGQNVEGYNKPSSPIFTFCSCPGVVRFRIKKKRAWYCSTAWIFNRDPFTKWDVDCINNFFSSGNHILNPLILKEYPIKILFLDLDCNLFLSCSGAPTHAVIPKGVRCWTDSLFPEHSSKEVLVCCEWQTHFHV